MSLVAYYYAFVPMLLGVAILAAGVRTSIGHLTQHVPIASAVALAGGVALFLAGNVAFRATLGIVPLYPRAAAATGVVATVPLGVGLSAIAELTGLVAVLVIMLLAEPFMGPHTR